MKLIDIKTFFYRLGSYLSLAFPIYTTWSRIHRLLFDRAAIGTVLPTVTCLDEISPYLRAMVWRPDSWIDLGDAICSPEMVWYRSLNAVDHKVGDCDEFAIFISNVIARSITAGTWQEAVDTPSFLTVTWIGADGVGAGHNVGLFRRLHTIAGHLYEDWGYMDYGAPIWCGHKQDVVDAIRKRYAGDGAIKIVWSVHTPTLGFVEAHWGE